MVTYICNKCGEKKHLMRATLVVIDGKVRTNLIRTEPPLSKKIDKKTGKK